MSEYLRNKVLDDNLDSVYVALISDGDEVDKDSYKRQSVEFSDADEGQTKNENEVMFPVAEGDWGDIDEVAIYDSESGGNELFKTEPKTIKNIEESGQYNIPEDYLVIRLR